MAVSKTAPKHQYVQRTLADLPPTITVPEAGRICGVSRNVAYRAVAAGELPAIRIGRRLVVPTAELLRLLGLEE